MVVYIKNEIDFSKCAEVLASYYPDKSLQDIEKAFTRFFWLDQRSEHWTYKSSVEDEIQSILVDFVAENENDSREAAETSLALSMQIINGNSSEVYKAGAWL